MPFASFWRYDTQALAWGYAMAGSGLIAFDRYVLDLADARLTGPDGPLAVGDKALRVLGALLDAGGRLVTKDELFDLAWNGVIVTESTLTTVIKELRRALSDPARTPRFIESVYGKGYRFLLPATTVATPAAVRSPLIGNLPNALSDLIGREEHIAMLDASLAGGGVVSVVGPAGVGKTSFALEVARRRADHHADGAWLVELATIRNADDIAFAVATAMRLELTAARKPRDALVDALRRREALLLLDNAEHLIEGVAEFVRALRAAAPGVTLLITSREALALAGETVVPLAALAPAAASALFAARAIAADPHFDPDGANAAPIAAICSRLDHLALAIEMAAARAPLLGCGAVLERLDNRFGLLTSGQRGGEARQRTLRAALEWSHDLLGPDEAAAFRRLGVFTSSFALAAGAAVITLGGCDKLDAFDAIASLVAKSLLVVHPGAEGMRYRMLETMRAFALERLDEAGEGEAAWRAKSQWLMAMTEPFWGEYFGTLSEAGLAAHYLVERDNIAAAIDWAQGSGAAPEVATRLFCNCWALWPEYRVHHMLPQMLERSGPGTAPDLRACLLSAEAHNLMRFSPIDAVERADEAIAAIDAAGADCWPLVDVLCSKGLALWLLGRVGEAEVVCAKLEPMVPGFAVSRLAAHAKGLRACLALARGGPAVARPIIEELDRELRGFGAYGLADFWTITMLQFDAEPPLDAQIEAWRTAIAAINPEHAYAEALINSGSLELVMRLGLRGGEEDLLEARHLLVRCFRRGGVTLEHRLFLAMALVALRMSRPNEGTWLFGVAEGRRRQGGETALTRASFARVRALVEQALPSDQHERLIREGEAVAASGSTESFAGRFRFLTED